MIETVGARSALISSQDQTAEGSREGVSPTANVERRRKELSPARRKVQVRSAQLIAEEMALQELRRARTQVLVARQFGIRQDGVSEL